MTRKVGVCWDAAFQAHSAGVGHPERAERLNSIREILDADGTWERLIQVPTRRATKEELERCHTRAHVEQVISVEGKSHMFDADTHASPGTTEAALLAAGGGIELVNKVLDGELSQGFALVRPPGHHAEHDRAMGFCYFNNIAVAARAAMQRDDVQRILLIDWDVHHGNGTQHQFDEEKEFLCISLHQYPFYPGTGRLRDIGLGEGKGYNINVPFGHGTGDHEFALFFEQMIVPVARQFQPDLILLSAGYDAHQRDPLGGMKVSTEGFAHMSHVLCELADEVCGGKLVAFLEGGYDLQGVGQGAATTLKTMLGDTLERSGDISKVNAPSLHLFNELQETFAPYWKLKRV